MEIKKIRPVVYVSGPYTAFEGSTVEQNTKIAQKYAHALRLKGFAVICPHSNGGDPEFIPDELTWQEFIEEDYSIILSCHAMFMLPNWKESKGSKIEREWAQELGIPVFYFDDCAKYLNALENLEYDKIVSGNSLVEESFVDIIRYFQGENTVWEKCPQQIHEFIKIINNMFRIHLIKNQDYSPYNILGVGQIGLASRIWDKVSRLMNLVGFDIGTGNLSRPKEPKNESLDDNLSDLCIYSIIWQIYRKNKWGC